MRQILLSLVLLLIALPVSAESRRYQLQPDGSQVGFTYVLSGVPGKGTMPIRAADISIDFANVPRTKADVSLDVGGARTSAVFVTQALKSPDVLHARAHPEIRFVSRKVTGSIRKGTRVEGDVTIRGVTRPMVLDAQIYKAQGSAAGDLSRLTVLLTGAINRSDFAAAGFSDLVEDRIELRILAQLSETG